MGFLPDVLFNQSCCLGNTYFTPNQRSPRCTKLLEGSWRGQVWGFGGWEGIGGNSDGGVGGQSGGCLVWLADLSPGGVGRVVLPPLPPASPQEEGAGAQSLPSYTPALPTHGAGV